MINQADYTYSNGSVALQDVNLNIFRGELIGIMGKNGAGKTTLIRTLNGLIRPDNGNIYIQGVNLSLKSIATLSKKIGIIFQNPNHQLFANTIEDEIKFSLKNLDLSKEEIQTRIDEILKEFNLEKYRDRSPLNLSGGESKKLAIASIICRDPDIIVFDEPTLGQDAKEIKFFIDLINEERQNGKTIIIVTHNIEFALEYIPRTILMADGKIIADGPTEKILQNESLIESSSLILPQIFQFQHALKEIGLNPPTMIDSKSEMLEFLKNVIKMNSKGDIK
jgi:energy-coupling factor transport system ATP-binding protein